MLKVAIIIGSTRPGRKAEVVARWVYDIASKRSDAAFEIVDIKDFNLPLLDEAVPAAMGQYSQPHTKACLRLRDARVQSWAVRGAQECDRLPAPRMEQLCETILDSEGLTPLSLSGKLEIGEAKRRRMLSPAGTGENIALSRSKG